MTANSDIARALRTAFLAMRRRCEAVFLPQGVTVDQFVLLANLARAHALTQRELARRISSDPSTVRAMLVLLAERGLVERDPHPTDARARTVSLTAKGKRKFQKLWNTGVPIWALVQDALLPAEEETLIKLLGRVAKALDPECVDGSIFLPRLEDEA